MNFSKFDTFCELILQKIKSRVPGHLKNISLKKFENYRFWLIWTVYFKTDINNRLGRYN
jgi:hypothetical protein